MAGYRWGVIRLVTGAAVLGVLVWRLGGGPFQAGLRSIDAWSLVAATALTVIATVCCAWRWRLVARGLGIEVALPAAIAAYYRSQFLNSALPGGVLGDVHRGVRHGREAHDVSRALRAVAWERSAGQIVQLAVAALVLIVLPSPVRADMPVVVLIGAVALVLVAVGLRTLPATRHSRWGRIRHAVVRDLRTGVTARGIAPGVVLASCGVVAAHLAVFVVAAHAVGADVSVLRLVPLATLVLVATALPTNIGGWGPREGAAAWVFGAAGLSASQGLTVSVLYGALVLVATLPGLVVIAGEHLGRGRTADA